MQQLWSRNSLHVLINDQGSEISLRGLNGYAIRSRVKSRPKSFDNVQTIQNLEFQVDDIIYAQ